jgi:hypothetical protein
LTEKLLAIFFIQTRDAKKNIIINEIDAGNEKKKNRVMLLIEEVYKHKHT